VPSNGDPPQTLGEWLITIGALIMLITILAVVVLLAGCAGGGVGSNQADFVTCSIDGGPK